MRRLALIAALALAVPASPASPAGGTVTIAMKGIAFEPRQVTAHVGDTLEWKNDDIVAHTATARDKSWEVNVGPGNTGRIVMNAAGRFEYFCRFHPNMKGEITIVPD